jgi:hypothetical protein
VSCWRVDQQTGQYDHAKHKWHLALRYRHFSLPQSSSASRFTAGASAFFISSPLGERLEQWVTLCTGTGQYLIRFLMRTEH